MSAFNTQVYAKSKVGFSGEKEHKVPAGQVKYTIKHYLQLLDAPLQFNMSWSATSIL